MNLEIIWLDKKIWNENWHNTGNDFKRKVLRWRHCYRKSVCGVQLLAFQKPINRLDWWNVCFISDAGNWQCRVGGGAYGLNPLVAVAAANSLQSRRTLCDPRIPGMGEPGGLPSLGSHRVGNYWSDLAVAVMWRTDWFEKILMLGKTEGREEKGTVEDEMVGWHHWLNGHCFGWTLGVVDGQGGLACCQGSQRAIEQLNWTESLSEVIILSTLWMKEPSVK